MNVCVEAAYTLQQCLLQPVLSPGSHAHLLEKQAMSSVLGAAASVQTE